MREEGFGRPSGVGGVRASGVVARAVCEQSHSAAGDGARKPAAA